MKIYDLQGLVNMGIIELISIAGSYGFKTSDKTRGDLIYAILTAQNTPVETFAPDKQEL